MGKPLVPAPAGSIPAELKKGTNPRGADRKIPSLLCQTGRGRCRSRHAGKRLGRAEPRLADTGTSASPMAQPGLEGTYLGSPSYSPTAISVGLEDTPILSPFFHPSLPLSTNHGAEGPHTSSPLRPALALQLF